jgi:hypothetical protein
MDSKVFGEVSFHGDDVFEKTKKTCSRGSVVQSAANQSQDFLTSAFG